jgi:hypothetical protein
MGFGGAFMLQFNQVPQTIPIQHHQSSFRAGEKGGQNEHEGKQGP